MYTQQQPVPIAGIYALQSTNKPFFPLFVPEHTSTKTPQQLSAQSLKQFELQIVVFIRRDYEYWTSICCIQKLIYNFEDTTIELIPWLKKTIEMTYLGL